MWRNEMGGARDMYLATSREGLTSSAPKKLGNGTWQLNACPMDGGGLVISPTGILTAWLRDARAYLASPDQAERQVGTGKDVAVASSGRQDLCRLGDRHEGRDLWMDGKVEALVANGAFPSVTVLPNGGAPAAWEETGSIQIRRLP